MSETFNIYCDESCHLENDHQKAMVLGAVWCPLDKTREIAVRLRVILADRGDYILPWTAYLVEQPHRQRKLRKEYDEYWRNQGSKS
jgi:hypothetical protein